MYCEDILDLFFYVKQGWEGPFNLYEMWCDHNQNINKFQKFLKPFFQYAIGV